MFRLAAGFSAAAAIGALATAPAALATGNYQWAGSDPATAAWQQPDNWAGNAAPSGAIGTLSFPDLGAGCDSGALFDTCYQSYDQLGSLTASQLTIDDDQAYNIGGASTSPLTLQAGLSAAPTEDATTDNMSGDPTLALPINLGANQSWSIDGGTQGNGYGINVAQLGGNQTLTVDFTNGGTLGTTVVSGSSAVVASGDGELFVQPYDGTAANLAPGGTIVQNGASLTVDAPTSTTADGPVTVSGSQASPSSLVIEGGSAPDAQLVATNASLGPSTQLEMELDSDNSNLDPSGNPVGFSRLTAVNVALGGATLQLDQGWTDGSGDCAALSVRDAFPIIAATSTLSGDLTYEDSSNNLDTLAPGQTSLPISVTLPTGCVTGAPKTAALVTLTYGARTITATVVAVPVQKSLPTISGTTQVGDTLRVTSDGDWSGSFPKVSSYAHQWLACSGGSCSPIPGAKGSSFTLTSAQVGDRVRVQVTATNAAGSTTADSNSVGPVTKQPQSSTGPTSGGSNGGSGGSGTSLPTPSGPAATGPAAVRARAALEKISHPSGTRAIRALIRTGTFRVRFTAPRAGSLRITWTTPVMTGKASHRRRKFLTVATGAGHRTSAGAMSVTVRLTAAGRALLKHRPHGFAVTATNTFRASDGWTLVRQHFRL